MVKNILLIFLIIIACSYCIAQSSLSLKNVDLGYLNDYSISYEIVMDKEHNVWVATEEGVLRNNSMQSFIYNEYAGLPSSFGEKIQNIVIDDINGMWISCENQLAKYDLLTKQFKEVKIIDQPHSIYIYDLEVFDQKLWVATFDGLFCIDLQSHRVVKKLLNSEQCQYLSKSSSDLVIGTERGSYYYNKMMDRPEKISNETVTSTLQIDDQFILGTKTGSLYRWSYSNKELRLINKVRYPILDIEKDDNNNIYIGTDGEGIYAMNSSLKTVAHYSSEEQGEFYLPINNFYDLHIDKDNELWATSYGGGIFKSNLDPEGIINIKNSLPSKKVNYVKSIIKTKEGDIWIGTREGLTIIKKNGQSIYKPKLGSSSVNDNILCFFESGDNVWVGTYGNGAYKVDKNTLLSKRYSNSGIITTTRITTDKVYAIVQDNKNQLWFGGIDGNLCRIDATGNLKTFPVGLIRSLSLSPDGYVYGANKKGVFYIDQDKVIPIQGLSDRTKFNYSTINCLTFHKNNIWVGTSGDGILIYDLRQKTIATFNSTNGLPSNVIKGIAIKNDDVWVSTSRGLVKLDAESRNSDNIEIFDERDGFLNATFNYGACHMYDDKELLLGSIDGASIVDLDRIDKDYKQLKFSFEFLETLKHKEKPDLYKINLFGTKTSLIKLAYWQNFIKINFAALNHRNPKKIRYAWLIEGVNERWSPPQSLNEVSISNLSPGKYKLWVKVLQNGIKNDDVNSLDIVINPPWWKSIYAYLFYLICIVAFLYAGYVFVNTYFRQKALDDQIQFFNNITHEIKTPLTILLNKLNGSNSTISTTEDIKLIISRMNTLFDQLLNYNKISSKFYQNQPISEINLEEHINMILNNFKQTIENKNINIHFENGFTASYFYYKKDVFDKICFNMISNAVKYTGQNGSIQIKLKNGSAGSLIFTITDNGIGIPKDQQKDILKRYYRARNAINSQETGTGLGLMMVKTLLEIDGGSISFVSEKDLGTSFTINLVNFKEKYLQEVNLHKPQNYSGADIEEHLNEGAVRPRILVVEDNDELRIDLVEKLSEHYTIIAARNGKEGFEKAILRVPDLIITDLIMPEMDGIELCRLLQKDPNTNHIPLFMVTVLNDSANKVASIKSGVHTFLNKPVDLPSLIAQINSVLEYREKIKQEIIKKAEMDKASQFKDDRSAAFIKEIEDFILDKVKQEEISVQDLCKHIGMSRTALYMKMKEVINQSPQNFIIITKMNHARDLLLHGGRSVQEIAFMVGFNNPKYFSTSFKKQFGMSPTTFLKSLNPQS